VSAQLTCWLAFAPERTSLTNALLASYALHLRNLIEFIYWTPKPPDDVNAVHYVRDKDAWLAARGEASDFLRGVKLRADKQIAHLTKKRFTGDAPEKQWDPIAEISALLPGLRLFLDHGRPELLHANVAAAIERLAALVTPKGED
jgi:hypothetical protein